MGAAATKHKQAKASNETFVVKLLLLGTGESGKSSVFKQLHHLYGKPLDAKELKFYTEIVHSNTCEAMSLLCEGVKTFGYDDDCVAKEELEAFLKKEPTTTSLFAESPLHGKTVGQLVGILWKDPAIQKAWERRNEIHVMESHRSFLDEIDRINSASYSPSVKDILHARVRSTGVATERHEIDGIVFELYDVGGQRNERKKWIHFFDNVDAIIYLFALSEYDQTCFEDHVTNRVVESLQSFEGIVKNPLFKTTPVILFMNKIDIFKQKIATKPISTIPLFSDFTGGSDFDKSSLYFRKKFEALALASHPDKQFFHHLTCATDTDNIKHVFDDCRAIITNATIASSGVV